MEVYIDDITTKFKDLNEHVKHLEKTFALLREYKMKLNLEKYQKFNIRCTAQARLSLMLKVHIQRWRSGNLY